MDKTKFTINPQLDSEGFTDFPEQPNPPGWQEVDSVVLPSVSPWAERTQEQRHAAKYGPGGNTLDPDRPPSPFNRDGSPNPWAKVSQSDLDAVHAIWSKSDGR